MSDIPEEIKNLPWDIMPVEAIKAVGRVMAKAQPEKGNHWKETEEGRSYMHQLGHAVEHRLSFLSGEDIDTSDNESNLAHMACRDLLALDHQLNGTAIDDRRPMPKKFISLGINN